jgi:hypothetical protein
MPLTGTIRDFGIADIFQLIGQQAKTGVLILKNDLDEVRVYFKDGAVVNAESATRPGQMLLGSLLQRAEVISQEQLDKALVEQRRTLKMLGLVLLEMGYIPKEALAEFATLQMTETIYGLFQWKTGTYEFETEAVEPGPEGVESIRAENIVMNGIRMVDEWPSIREKLPSYSWMVERVKSLPPPKPKRAASSTDLELALSGLGEEQRSQSIDLDDIGAFERQIYNLISPGRDVQKIIDLARIGEFEACRALGNLMSAGYVRVVKPIARAPESEDVPAETPAQVVLRYLGLCGRVSVSAVLVMIAAMLVGRIQPAQLGLDPGGELAYEARPVESHFSESQMRVIRRELEVYRYETGVYPKSLQALVDAGMLTERDIRFPFHRPYFYRVQGNDVLLLRPVN